MENKSSKKKAFYITLAILVSVVIWIFVDLTTGTDGTPKIWTKEFKDVPIEYVGEDTVLADRGLMLVEAETDLTADVTVEGTHWELAKLDKSNLLVQADLSMLNATGIQSVATRGVFTVRALSQKLTIKEVNPYMATVNIGELYSKTVEVRYEIAGNVAEGYSAGEVQLSPASFEIRGQKDAIDTVSYAKVVLDIGEDAISTVTQELNYQFYDENDQLVEEDIHSDVSSIQVTLPVNITKMLELTMDFQESPGASLENVKWKIEPQYVSVTGDAEQLRNINSLVLSKFDLLTLDSSTIYNYVIPIPEGCENLSNVSQATLRASFIDMVSAEVTTNRIQYDHLPEGKHVTILTTEMPVEIFGTSADVNSISGEDVLVVADLSDFAAAVGSYTVPARILVNTNRDVGVSGTYQVRVTISEEAPGPEEAEEPSVPNEEYGTGDST